MANHQDLMKQRLDKEVYQLLIYARDICAEGSFKPYVVGGFVRDLFLGRRNLDIDIVVEGDVSSFVAKYSSKLQCPVKYHDVFGTATMMNNSGLKVDVATARTEVYTRPGALPMVSPGSIKDDLFRRDFTINAMALALSPDNFGDLVDFSNGYSDLQKGIIRVLHDKSFIDDPTRIYRAIRFEQRYKFTIESHTDSLLKQAVEDGALDTVSSQRLLNELFIFFKEDDPLAVIKRALSLGLINFISPKIVIHDELYANIKKAINWYNTRSTTRRETIDQITIWLLFIFDALDQDETENAVAQLPLENKHKQALVLSKRKLPLILKELRSEDRSSAIYESLNDLPLEVVIFALSKTYGSGSQGKVERFLSELRNVNPLINGDDLRKLGYPQGPIYGEILNTVLSLQLDRKLTNKVEALEFVKQTWRLNGLKSQEVCQQDGGGYA